MVFLQNPSILTKAYPYDILCFTFIRFLPLGEHVIGSIEKGKLG